MGKAYTSIQQVMCISAAGKKRCSMAKESICLLLDKFTMDFSKMQQKMEEELITMIGLKPIILETGKMITNMETEC